MKTSIKQYFYTPRQRKRRGALTPFTLFKSCAITIIHFNPKQHIKFISHYYYYFTQTTFIHIYPHNHPSQSSSLHLKPFSFSLKNTLCPLGYRLWAVSSPQLQAYLSDTTISRPNHCNEGSTAIKQLTQNFWFPSAHKLSLYYTAVY